MVCFDHFRECLRNCGGSVNGLKVDQRSLHLEGEKYDRKLGLPESHAFGVRPTWNYKVFQYFLETLLTWQYFICDNRILKFNLRIGTENE